MSNEIVVVLVTQGFLAVSGVAAYVASDLKARRERKWLLEDQQRRSGEIMRKLDDNKAEVLAQTTDNIKNNESKIDQMHRTTKKDAVKIQRAIKENTEVSVKAFDEANGVNEKIANGIERTAALESRFDGLEEVLFNLEETIHRALPQKEESTRNPTATDIFVDRRELNKPAVKVPAKTARRKPKTT